MAMDAKTSYDQTLPLHIYLKILIQKLRKFFEQHNKYLLLGETVICLHFVVALSIVCLFCFCFLGKIDALY